MTLGAGGFVEEVALLTGEPPNATVVATVPVRAVVIEQRRFSPLLDRVPSIREKVEARCGGPEGLTAALS